tara:strand:- start:89 stop:406 length:318 start_codon:yes stop_codon:yes gene_type:complete
MNKFWEDFKNSVSEWSIVASEKAEEFTHNSKLRIDILQLERKLSALYVKLGLYVFAKTQENNVLNFVGDKRYLGLVENIVELKKKISSIKDSMNHEKEEIIKEEE